MDNQSIEQYRYYIRDKNIWWYIFGKERPRLDNSDALLRCINNTVNLTFFYVFSCIRDMYKNDDDSDIKNKIKGFNPNARRAIKNIDRIYNGLDISFELINYILLDVQFDLALGNSSCLKQYIPGVSEDFMPLDYSPLIMRWMCSSNTDNDITLDDLIEHFQKLIVSLGYLSSFRLVKEDDDEFTDVLFESTGFDRRKIYTDRKIHIQDCGRGIFMYYFLERVEIKEHACLLHYSTPDYADKHVIIYHDPNYPTDDDRDEYDYRLGDAADLRDLCFYVTGYNSEILATDQSPKDKGIQNIYAINYKYLKNLSLAISDELGDADNIDCRTRFLRRYGADPEKVEDLDGFIIMKLVENSPTSVLYELFCINPNSFHSIIRNLYRRFNERIVFEFVNFKRQPPDFTELDSKVNKNESTGDKAEYQANYIISMLLSNSQSDYLRAKPITENISNIVTRKKLSDAQNSLSQIIMRLCVFYHGLLAYGREKRDYDATHYDRILSEKEISLLQSKLHSCFIENATDYYNEQFKNYLKTDDSKFNLDYAINQLSQLLEICEDRDNERFLKCVLGKNEVFERNQFGLFENLTEMEEKAQLKQIVDCLEFLNTGSLEKNESLGDFNSSIYPVIGKYRSSNESDDKCRVANFSIRIDVNNNGQHDFMKRINVLSEFNYQINAYYYCLPNITRCNSDWWIDPLIIKTSDFDAIFKEG